MAERFSDDFLSDVLHGRIPGVPKLADLTSFWRKHTLEEPDPDHPEYPLRSTLLAGYINRARTNGWAREGLRGLLRDLLLDEDEPIPETLISWAVCEYALSDRAPKRGRPEESDRDYHVIAGFEMLKDAGYTRTGAIEKIADLMLYEPENIRSIIRKHEKNPSYR